MRVEVVAARRRTVSAIEHRRLQMLGDLVEERVVGGVGHLEDLGLASTHLAEQTGDVFHLRLDRREVRESAVGVRAVERQEVRETRNGNTLEGLETVVAPPLSEVPALPSDHGHRGKVGVPQVESGGEYERVDLVPRPVGAHDGVGFEVPDAAGLQRHVRAGVGPKVLVGECRSLTPEVVVGCQRPPGRAVGNLSAQMRPGQQCRGLVSRFELLEVQDAEHHQHLQ